MKSWCVKNNKGQEVLCECPSKPFDYLENVLESEKRGWLPKGLFSNESSIRSRGGWCNTYTQGYYTTPTLVGVVVPDGTFEKLGIKYEGEPVELK